MSTIQISLIGTPNSGKTSLFNCLADEQNMIGNWDGVTVNIAASSYVYLGYTFKINDLPGCYSLVISEQMSLEEKLACEYLNELKKDIFINVISTENLTRDLYLTLQLLEQNCNMIIALNINSIEQQKYQKLAIHLQNTLGCKVVCCNAVTGFGILELQNVIIGQANGCSKTTNILQKYLPQQILEECKKYIGHNSFKSIGELIRFLEGDIFIKKLYQHINLSEVLSRLWQSGDIFFASKRHQFIKQNFIINNYSCTKDLHNISTFIDKIVLNQYAGLPMFFLVIYLMFFCVTEVGNLLQGGLDFIIKYFINLINSLLNLLNCPDWFLSIFNNGIVVGLNTLLSFIPALLTMQACLFVLENSGYIARAIFLIDRFMGFLGLSGKSLIPMIIGFGCNVPAILGATVIEQKRDRIITILMTPFMSCSARLVTYSVFATAFFASNQAKVIFYLYLIGIVSAILTGFVLQKFLSGSRTNLIMELPKYSMPSLNLILKKSIDRVRGFLMNSGLVIITVCTIIAGLKTINLLQYNLLNCALLKYIMLIFKPMGILENNWQAVAGLFSGLVAKEVIVGSLNAFYNSNNQEILGVLYTQFGSQKAAFAYLLFVLLSFPCVSVIASIARELNTRWAIFSVMWTTGLAYTVSVCYYQLATFNDHPEYSIKLLLQLLSVLCIILFGVKLKFNTIKIKTARMIPIIVG